MSVDQRRRLHLALRIGHYPTPEVATALFPNGNSVYCTTDMQAAQQRNFWGGIGFSLVIMVFANEPI